MKLNSVQLMCLKICDISGNMCALEIITSAPVLFVLADKIRESRAGDTSGQSLQANERRTDVGRRRQGNRSYWRRLLIAREKKRSTTSEEEKKRNKSYLKIRFNRCMAQQ